jgi:hypothetical protein
MVITRAQGFAARGLRVGALGFLLALLPAASGECAGDKDADGVADAADRCVGTAKDAVVDGSGCSIEDRCPCVESPAEVPWKGWYAACVARTSRDFSLAGLIPTKRSEELIAEAGKSQCTKVEPEHTATLRVQTLDNSGRPDPSAATVLLDGIPVSATGADGLLSLEVAAARSYRVRARVPGAVGSPAADVTVAEAGGSVELQLDREGLREDADLVVSEGLSAGALSSDVKQLALRFEWQGGGIAPFKELAELRVRPAAQPEGWRSVKGQFAVAPDGVISLADAAAFRELLKQLPAGDLQLEASGEDADGRFYRDSAELKVARR